MSALYAKAVKAAELTPRIGRVLGYRGLVLEASGPDAFLGEVCELYGSGMAAAVKAEVVGFRGDNVLLMPYGELRGLRRGCEVLATGRFAQIAVGEGMLGRVLDAFGKPIDGKGDFTAEAAAPLNSEPLNPAKRSRVQKVFETGIKVLDTCLPIGIGQRMGLFAGSGVGKSSLLGMLAQQSAADVNVVALIGERGREVRDFIEEHLSASMHKTVVIVAAADQPALIRTHAAMAALSVAEYFRNRGKQVCLLFDSLTRFAMAQREVGLAAGEPPTARGYTPSVFSWLPRLVERAGPGESGQGSITAFFTVLVEGDDLSEPISDNVRALLDGHIVLSRALAQRAQFPPVDLLKSASRLSRQLLTSAESAATEDAISLLALYDNSRDMLDFGAYKPGINAKLDRAVALQPRLESFLQQRIGDTASRQKSWKEFVSLLASQIGSAT